MSLCCANLRLMIQLNNIVLQLWWNYVIFNRLRLLNIGFKEASEIDDYDCFIFHDVDHIPLNQLNLYWCSQQPRHLAFAVYTKRYRIFSKFCHSSAINC